MNKKKIALASVMISVLAIVSKALGLFRVMAINWKFGQSLETDAFNAALKINATSMSIIATAVLTSLLPVLIHVKERHGIRGKFKFFNNISNIVIVISLVISALVFAFAPQIMHIMYPKFEGEKFVLAVKLTRLAVPTILSLALMNLVTAYLHSFNIYGPYAFIGIPLNLIYFVYLFCFPVDIKGLTIVAVIAILSQFLIQVPSMFKTGYRYRPLIQTHDRYVDKTLRLVIPIAIGQAVQQINVVVDQNLASGLGDGVISALDNATKVNEAVIAIFIVGFTTVIFPLLSEAFEKKDRARMVDLLDDAMGATFLITLPCTVGIAVLSKDIIKIMFERGAFTKEDTAIAAGAFLFYGLGLTGMGLRTLLSKVFYSLKDMKTPMINGGVAVIINVVLNFILVKFMAQNGLALATTVSTTASTLILIYNLKKILPEISVRSYIREFVKILISSIGMGLAVYFVNMTLESLSCPQLIRIVIDLGVAVLVYLSLVFIFRVRAIEVYVRGFFKKKLKSE